MGIEGIVCIILGASLVGLGVAIGGVIEHKINSRRLQNNEDVYNHNVDEICRSLWEIEKTVKILQQRISSTTDEIRTVKNIIEKYDPQATQIIDPWGKREQVDTPSLPYAMSKKT